MSGDDLTKSDKTPPEESPGIDLFVIVVLVLVLLPGLFFIPGLFRWLLGFPEVTSVTYFRFACFYLFFLFLNLCAASIFYLTHFGPERRKLAAWRPLIKAHQLTVIRGPFHRGGAYLTGHYRGHQLRLETPRQEDVHTRLILSANPSSLPLAIQEQRPDHKPLVAEVSHLFDLTQRLPDLKGHLNTGPQGHVLIYEQKGYAKNADYLQRLFDLLSDLGDLYPKVIEIGGKLIPSLQVVATNPTHKLRQVALQWLQDIGQETTRRLSPQAAHLICPACLLGCTAQEVRLSAWQSIKYYGCRGCRQSQAFFSGSVIAVLDNTTNSEQFQQENRLWVNWLIRRNFFDFDEIEIRQATDEEVERFAVQAGNDTDPLRQPRYKQMPCRVSAECRLAENTLKVLRRIFGEVEVKNLHHQGKVERLNRLNLHSAGEAGNLPDVSSQGLGDSA